METYKQLKDRQQKEVNDLPLFFFLRGFGKSSDAILDKMGVTSTDEIVSVNGMFYCRKTDFDMIIATFERHKQEREQLLRVDGKYNMPYVVSMFFAEMVNHEFAINSNGKEEVLIACNISEEDFNKNKDLLKAWEKARKEYFKKVDC